jgi:FlaA1/EpsC-like NDP-sugar epimerase
MPETILVTGATGTPGSEIVKQLSAKEETIKAAVLSANDNTFENLKSSRCTTRL